MGHRHPDAMKHLKPPWKKGESPNPRGRPKLGASFIEWLYILGDQNEDGTAKFPEGELRKIAANKWAAPMKRTAAKLWPSQQKSSKDCRSGLPSRGSRHGCDVSGTLSACPGTAR